MSKNWAIGEGGRDYNFGGGGRDYTFGDNGLGASLGTEWDPGTPQSGSDSAWWKKVLSQPNSGSGGSGKSQGMFPTPQSQGSGYGWEAFDKAEPTLASQIMGLAGDTMSRMAGQKGTSDEAKELAAAQGAGGGGGSGGGMGDIMSLATMFI